VVQAFIKMMMDVIFVWSVIKMSIENAIIAASFYHRGQKDKTGQPYIYHPIRVMLNCQTEEEKIVGIMHDIVEDTDITLEKLAASGFNLKIVNAIDAISKRNGETRKEYITRCKQNELAKSVKFADITDNMSPLRQMHLDTKTQERLTKKYKEGLKLLLGD
jgi:(p)ppGpp synthase/HD superfamily hydrolase